MQVNPNSKSELLCYVHYVYFNSSFFAPTTNQIQKMILQNDMTSIPEKMSKIYETATFSISKSKDIKTWTTGYISSSSLFASPLLLDTSLIGRRNVAGISAQCFGMLADKCWRCHGEGSDGGGPFSSLLFSKHTVVALVVWASTSALTRYLESMCDCTLCISANCFHGER